MTTYTSPFTGTAVTPTDVSYLSLNLTANTTQLYWPEVVNPAQTVAARIIQVTNYIPSTYTVTSNTTSTFTFNPTTFNTGFAPGVSIQFGTSPTIYTVVSVGSVSPSGITVTFTPALNTGTSVTSVTLTNGITLALPDATQGATGTDILISNVGLYAINITDSVGNALMTVNPGISQYFYLINNDFNIGPYTWSSVTFGAGTSAANASSLAGAGLTTILNQLAIAQNIVQTSIGASLSANSRANTYVYTGGAITFTLPTAASLSLPTTQPGWWIGFRNAGTGALSFTPQGTSLINGLSTIATNPGDSGFIYFDASTNNFYTIGLANQNNVTFTSGTYDVDSISGSTFSLASYAPSIQTYVALSGTRSTTLNITLPAITQLYVLVNSTAGSYNLSFNTSGSSSSPVILAAGQTALVLSQASGLTTLTTSTAGVFNANNGSATNPSFSFINDSATGMYLRGTSILGLTANGTEMLDINNTNTLAPVITTPATLNVGGSETVTGTLTAGLISGGSF